jgi:hypothetical protein
MSMAIRPVPKEVPTRFVPARLFLDDIEEILLIFAEAETNRHEKPYFREGENLQTTFQAENQACDGLADLKNIYPPFAHKFFVSVARGGFNCYLRVDESSTTWNPYGLDENDQWGTFHRLELIFERRELRWKSLLHSHSGVFYSIYGATTALLTFLLPVLLFPKLVPRALTLTALAVLAILVFALRFGLHTHSVVMFRTHADHSSQKLQTAWKVIPDIIKILVGFVLGVLTLYLKHKFWP